MVCFHKKRQQQEGDDEMKDIVRTERGGDGEKLSEKRIELSRSFFGEFKLYDCLHYYP